MLLQSPQGKAVPKGDPGAPGPFPGALPSGKTVRGAFDVEGVAWCGDPEQSLGTCPISSTSLASTLFITCRKAPRTRAPPAHTQEAPGHTWIHEQT